MDTLRWEKTYYEKIQHEGRTFLVSPRNIHFIKLSDKHLVVYLDGTREYNEVIGIEDSSNGSKIIRYLREDKSTIFFQYRNDTSIYHVHKILKINLTSKEFWRNKK